MDAGIYGSQERHAWQSLVEVLELAWRGLSRWRKTPLPPAERQ